MKITTTKSDLLAALQTAERATSTRSVLPALGGILIEATEDGVVFRATDTEIGISHHLSAVRVEQPGAALVGGQLATNVVRNLPDGEVVVETGADDSSLDINAGAAHFSLRVLNRTDFPPEPAIEGDPVKIAAAPFTDAISLVSRAASRDEIRPVLTGVLIQADGNSLTVVATDSYRLSVKKAELQSPSGDFDAIVPASTLRELSRIVAAEGVNEIEIRKSSNQVLFICGDTKINTRLIDGQFPNWEKLIPTEFDYFVDLPQGEILEIGKRVGYLAQRNAPIRIGLADGEVTVSAQTPDIGEASESLPVEYSGDPMEISFNPQYLIDGIDSIEAENVRLKVSSPLRPGLLQAADDESFSYLIMPIRPNT